MLNTIPSFLLRAIARVLAASVVAGGCHRVDPALETMTGVVGATPVMSVGGETLELAAVTGAGRLRDGSVLIANTGSFPLFHVGADGNLLGRRGRQGGGPREYRGQLTLIATTANDLTVYDGGLTRWSAVDDSGNPLRAVTLDGAPTRPSWLASGAPVSGCGFAAGTPAPAGWSDGEIVCGR